MSATETLTAVTITRQRNYMHHEMGQVIVFSIRIDGIFIGDLNYYANQKEPPKNQWQVSLFEATLFGFGASPVEAIRDAFGDRLEVMLRHINRAKSIAVEHGAEIIRQAEAIQ